jgi:hypothetical protein
MINILAFPTYTQSSQTVPVDDAEIAKASLITAFVAFAMPALEAVTGPVSGSWRA